MNMHMRAADRGNLSFRSVSVRPNSFDPATGTFTAVIATETPVQRRGFKEVLRTNGARLPERVPLVLDHANDLRSRVGAVTNPRVDGDGAIIGDGRISPSDASLDWLRARMTDGEVDFSVAYSVDRWASTRDADGPVKTAESWSLRHVALVAEPADPMTGIRSADDDSTTVDDLHIKSLCRSLSLSREIEDRAVSERWSDAEIRAVVVDRSRIDIRTNGHNSETLDNPEAYHRAAVHSLVNRMTGEAPQGAARQLAGMSWPEFHRQHLRRAGHSVAGLSDVEVIHRALSTSDMPLIAGSAVNVTVRRTYEASQSPLAALAGSRSNPDFREVIEATPDWTTLRVDTVTELAEFKSSVITESGEPVKLHTVGGITGVSRQAFVNGARVLSGIGTMQGKRLAAAINDRRAAFVLQNTGAGPLMRDGAAVFSAAPGGRGNVLPLDNTSVDTVIDSVLAARAAMVRRMGAGDVMIGQLPAFWLVAPEFEGMAIRALAQITAATASDVNPLAGKLSVVSEPRLTDENTSYLACAPNSFDGMVQVSLDGQPGPYTESRWGFEIDALQFKIRLDLGFSFLEWRSWTRLDHAEGEQ